MPTTVRITSASCNSCPSRSFPFPKVALCSRGCACDSSSTDKPDAVILDFFSGSGTTAHAVMRLNRQDGGRRQCICVTNNEVGADEQKALREQGLRPGDPEWEQWASATTSPSRASQAAITGKTPDGEPIKGDYKFTDEFPMADGFEENAEFFTLTYETPVAVSYQTRLRAHRAAAVAARGQRGPPHRQTARRGLGRGRHLRPAGRLDQATRFPQSRAQGRRLCGSPTSSPTTSGAFRRWRAPARRRGAGPAVRVLPDQFRFANGDDA